MMFFQRSRSEEVSFVKTMMAASVSFLAWTGLACGAESESKSRSAVQDSYVAESVYRYRLVESHDRAVCGQMKRLYNKRFGRPWNFREYFRAREPQVFEAIFGSERQTPVDGRIWSRWGMRYALSPVTPEFSSVQWRDGSVVDDRGEIRSQLRMMTLDIDNDGEQESLFQISFYGSGTADGAKDAYIVYRDADLSRSPKTQFTNDELINSMAFSGVIEGVVLRPFVMRKIVYLSVYVDGEDSCCRNVSPESIAVVKVLANSATGPRKELQLQTVCRFDMEGRPSLVDEVGRTNQQQGGHMAISGLHVIQA